MTLKSTVLLLLAILLLVCQCLFFLKFLCFCLQTRNPKVAQAEVATDVVRTTSRCVRV